MTRRTSRIGLVLGGGAARGIAHVGVLKVLVREGLGPDLIIGTSIGALIGAMFAVHPDADRVRERIEQYMSGDTYRRMKFDFLKAADGGPEKEGLLGVLTSYARKSLFYGISLTRRSFVAEDDYLDNIAALVDDISIQDTRIRLATVCTDLHSGERVVLTEGPLRKAVAASSAIPGVFPPIDVGGRLLMDGGWVDQLPADVCRDLGGRFVIAVDVARDLEKDFSFEHGMDILWRANLITRHTLNQIRRKAADFVISPEVGDINWTAFESVAECIKRGEEAAARTVPQIRYLLKKRTSLLSRLTRKHP